MQATTQIIASAGGAQLVRVGQDPDRPGNAVYELWVNPSTVRRTVTSTVNGEQTTETYDEPVAPASATVILCVAADREAVALPAVADTMDEMPEQLINGGGQ